MISYYFLTNTLIDQFFFFFLFCLVTITVLQFRQKARDLIDLFANTPPKDRK